MQFLFLIISSILLFFLVFPFATVLFSRLFKEDVATDEVNQTFDFACIITAYKNVAITEHLVQSLLKQSHTNFHIYLVADDCNPADFSLADERLSVFYPNPPLRLKAKSIIHAIQNLSLIHI